MDKVVVWPRSAPRDGLDLARTALAGLVLLVALLVLPLLAAGLVRLLAGDWFPARLAGLSLFFAQAILVSLRQVHWLKLDDGGIRFGRWIGKPRHLPWSRIVSVRPADPAEVVRRGWLWPPLNPREATRSLTAHGHWRIDWDGGSSYFPPRDEHAFRTAVERRARWRMPDRRTGVARRRRRMTILRRCRVGPSPRLPV